MKKWIKWTSEEDDILIQSIKDNPHNREEAFRIASSKINRTVMSCHTRWYQILSNPKSRHYVGSLFTTVGTYKLMKNKTSSRYTEPIIYNNSIWSKIKKLLHL